MAFVDRVEEICRHCVGKRVLHLGCADWPYTERRIQTEQLLHSRIADVSAHVVGVDMSAEGLDMMKKLHPAWDLRLHDACTFKPDQEFDVIVASELIEHLENPGSLFRSLATWANSSHSLVLTTPNAYSLKGAARALFGKEFNHPDHTVLFSTQTLGQMLDRCGWRTAEVKYYQSPPRGLMTSIIGHAAHALSSVLSQRSGDGLIVIAKRAAENAGSNDVRKAA